MFETYSVLTRRPVPLRLSAEQVDAVLSAAFPAECWLDPQATGRLCARMAALGVIGGSVYDALVGQAAAENERVLLTRDRRAERTYRALDVSYRFVE